MLTKFSSLKLEALGVSDVYRLLSDFIWSSSDYGDVIVHEDTITDLDSIPRIPFLYSFLKGRARRAYVLHDNLYKTRFLTTLHTVPGYVDDVGPSLVNKLKHMGVTRKESDVLLKRALSDELPDTLVSKVVIILVYYGTRLGGWYRWNKAQQRKRELENCYACK